MKKRKAKKAAKWLREYCYEQTDCDVDCQFYDHNKGHGCMLLLKIPMDWKLKATDRLVNK